MPKKKKIKESVELTGTSLLRKLRKASKPPGKRPMWISHLSDQRLAEVFHRLKAGQAAHKIAKVAQEEWGIKPEAQTRSLARAVREFAKRALGELHQAQDKADDVQKMEISKVLEKGQKAIEKFDALEKLKEVAQIQFSRVHTLVERENKALPFKFTDKTISVLADILDRILKYEVELGLRDSKPSEWTLNIKNGFDGMLNMLEGQETKFIDATNTFMDRLDEHAVTMKMQEDGSYTLEGPGLENATRIDSDNN